MKPRGQAVAAAASALVGVPFRIHGRDPRFGLDCVGLVACALKAVGVHPITPSGYAMRNASILCHLRCAEASGMVPADPPIEAGDILLVEPGPAQQHLIVADGRAGFIHAHAGLRKVVRMCGPLPWAVVTAWRLKPEN